MLEAVLEHGENTKKKILGLIDLKMTLTCYFAWYTAHHDIAVSLEINYVVQGNYLTLRTRSQISSLIVELNVAKNRYDLAVISRLFKSD